MLNSTATTREGKTISELAAMANDPRMTEAPDSSTGEQETKDAKEPGSMQEAVAEALAGRTEAETEPDSSTEQNATGEVEIPVEGAEASAKDDKKEPVLTPEQQQEQDEKAKREQERLDKNPRFQEVLQERNALKPLAEYGKADQEYCQQWNISGEQKKTAMELLALINTKPDEAVKTLEQLVENLKLQTGAKLPEDLAKRVADNLISQEDAMELHRARLTNTRLQQQQERFQQQTAAEQATQVGQALGQWGVAKMKVDTDFKPKAQGAKDGKFELVQDRIQVLSQRSGKKSFTPAEATALAEEAYSYVSDLYRQFNPQRRNGRVAFPSQRSFKEPNEGEEPATLAEAVQRAVRKHGLRIGSQ